MFRIFGLVAFAGPLYTRDCLTFGPHAENWWQWVEIAGAVGCATLFSFGRGRRLPAAVIPIVVSIHFGYWFIVQWSGNIWYQWQLSALLILPFCLALSWAFYEREQQGRAT